MLSIYSGRLLIHCPIIVKLLLVIVDIKVILLLEIKFPPKFNPELHDVLYNKLVFIFRADCTVVLFITFKLLLVFIIVVIVIELLQILLFEIYKVPTTETSWLKIDSLEISIFEFKINLLFINVLLEINKRELSLTLLKLVESLMHKLLIVLNIPKLASFGI